MQLRFERVLKQLKKQERYRDFTIFEEPVPFESFAKGKSYKTVQLHSIQPVLGQGIVGFCGVAKWEKDNILSLDGETYTKSMSIYGYEEFGNGGIDVLVGDDW